LTRVFPCGFDLPCDGYACSKRAAWFIGEERNHFVVAKLCDECMDEVVKGWKELAAAEPGAAEENAETNLPPEEPEETPRYVCKRCGKEYTTLQALTAHGRWCRGA
jgi:hypothetical protein